jgi:hypothetical protein
MPETHTHDPQSSSAETLTRPTGNFSVPSSISVVRKTPPRRRNSEDTVFHTPDTDLGSAEEDEQVSWVGGAIDLSINSSVLFPLGLDQSIDEGQAKETKEPETVATSSHPLPTIAAVPDLSLKDTEREALKRKMTHLSFMAFGRRLTFAAILFAIAGLILAILAKRSLFFVKLGNSMEISPQLEHVDYMGLVRVQLCYNETYQQNRQLKQLDYPSNARHLNTESSPETPVDTVDVHSTERDCFILLLTEETVNDTMWNVSRSFLSLAIAFGSFLTLMLSLSVYWESINLKPIAVGLLLTYFLQSLSFFFFDSDLCRNYKCSLNEGSVASILASLFWFLSGMLCIRMDVTYQSKQRKWKRRYKRALTKLRLQRLCSGGTDATTPLEDDEPPERSTAIDEEAQVGVSLKDWKGYVGVIAHSREYTA